MEREKFVNPLRQETVLQLLKQNFKDQKTRGLQLGISGNSSAKVNSDALKIIMKYIYLFVLEGAYRSVEQAKVEDSLSVELEHLEKILPQLILDF